MSTPVERRIEISKAVSDAMRSLGNGYDFAQASPEITRTGHELDEAMADYADGKVTKPVVQSRYKVWRDLHKTGAKA